MYQKLEHKRQLLIEQSLNDRGNMYRYLKGLYNLYLKKSQEQGRNYAVGVKLKEEQKVLTDCDKAAYNHYTIIPYYRGLLKDLGYISVKKVDNEWRIYILKELDF